ncbi:MAG: hypothetical protein R3D58_15230 [Saprospiraceae bacterium]
MKDLPRIFGILAGGLSLFKLGSYLLNVEFSKILELIVIQYDKILEPIRFFFSPIANWIAREFNFALPEWWTHLVVIWLLLGAIALRAGATVDKETGQVDKSNFFVALIGDIFLSLFGAALLALMTVTWIKHEMIIHHYKPDASKEKGYVSPFKILARETLITIAATIVFFAVNAFT